MTDQDFRDDVNRHMGEQTAIMARVEKWLDSVDKKTDDINAHGGDFGKAMDKRLQKVEAWPKRAAIAVVGLVGGSHGISAWVSKLFG